MWILFFFFFSSRRRHTRSLRDWSSDVCSSDLGLGYAEEAVRLNSHMPLGHYLLGSLLLYTDQTARAISELETAQRSLPNEPRVYFALGRAYARSNRKEDAARAPRSSA